MKPLKYPYTYKQWLLHPSTKPKLKWIKETCQRWRDEEKFGKQLKIKI
jgi:hypothetical protein